MNPVKITYTQIDTHTHHIRQHVNDGVEVKPTLFTELLNNHHIAENMYNISNPKLEDAIIKYGTRNNRMHSYDGESTEYAAEYARRMLPNDFKYRDEVIQLAHDIHEESGDVIARLPRFVRATLTYHGANHTVSANDDSARRNVVMMDVVDRIAEHVLKRV